MRRSSPRRLALLLVVAGAACFAAFAAPASASSVSIDTTPAPNANSGTIDFTANPSAGATCTLDTKVTPDCSTHFPYGPLDDGSHTFKVDVVDDGKGPGPLSAPVTWTVDTTPPTVTPLNYPPDPTTATSATFTFQADDPEATFTCALDGGPPSSCSSGAGAGASYLGLAPGPHSFSVVATDQLRNTKTWPYTWNVVPLPTPQNLNGPTLSNGVGLAFTFSDPDPTATFECRVDGNDSTYAPCVSGAPWTGQLSNGSHTFYVRRVSAGSVPSLPATWVFALDQTPPVTAITGGPFGTTTSADATFSFRSEPGATFVCSLDGAPAAPCTSPKAYLGLTSGPHTFSVAAVDSAGNVDPTPATSTWAIQGAPHPSFTASNLNPLTGVPVTFTSTSTADLGYYISALAWDLDGDGLFNDGTGASATRAFATPGNHTVRLNVRSEPGGGNGTAEMVIRVGDRPPVAGFSVRPRVPRARAEVDVVSTASDPDTPIASQVWSVRERGVRLRADGGSATLRFPKAGTYHVSLRVTDSLGAVTSITKTLKVREQPVPPWLVDISGLPRMAGARFTKLRVRAPRGAKVYVRCLGRRCRVRRAFRKTVGRSANLYVRSYQTFFWTGSVIEIQVSVSGYQTKFVKIRVRGHNHGVSRYNGCVVPGKRPGRCR